MIFSGSFDWHVNQPYRSEPKRPFAGPTTFLPSYPTNCLQIFVLKSSENGSVNRIRTGAELSRYKIRVNLKIFKIIVEAIHGFIEF